MARENCFTALKLFFSQPRDATDLGLHEEEEQYKFASPEVCHRLLAASACYSKAAGNLDTNFFQQLG